MRTTVTLDKDVERMLREKMHRARASFKKTLNDTLRTGLVAKSDRSKPSRFTLKARPMNARAGIDPAGFNKLADELEADAALEKMKRTGA